MSRMLVVEDDAIIAADIAETLTRLGYEVLSTADSAEQALQAVTASKPDLVLMDVKLRGEKDGVDAVTMIRRQSDVPVVYLTSHTDDATLARAKETAPHGYLVKPFNERDLRTAIEVALRKHELERHLADRERWFSTTLESLGDAVIATDAAERITFMNQVAARVTGHTAADVIGKSLGEVLDLTDRDGRPIESPVGRAIRSNFAVTLPPNTTLRHRDGAPRDVDDTATPIVDSRGELLGGVVVFRDVTEQKRLERRVAIAERMASVGTMAAGIAHEINNPLASVIGNFHFVLEELKDVVAELQNIPAAAGPRTRLASAVTALRDAAESSERVRKIVMTMRAFTNQAAPERTVVDVPDLVDAALRVTGHALRHKAKVVRAYGTTPFVDVDEGQIIQVLTNLLTNACDAIPDGHANDNEVRVTTYTDDQGRAVAEVHDTGAGIAPQALARVFDPFFSTKGIGGGMGLGLSICHSFVVAAGGELSVESQLGRGATFRVALPAATRPKTLPSPPPMAAVPSGKRARVLVLDDEPTVAAVIGRVLRDHDVVIETDPKAALARIAAGERFDVFFCDLMMPNMSGMDVFEAVKVTAPELVKRMVFCTGGAFSRRAEEFIESVPNAVLQKPFAAEDLLTLVEDFVR